MTLGEKIIAALEEFRDDLQTGERITVSTIERCGCDSGRMSKHQQRCHICGGKGFIVDGKSFLPVERKDVL